MEEQDMQPETTETADTTGAPPLPEPAGDLGHRPPAADLDDVPAENTAAGVLGSEVDPAPEQ